MEQSAQKDVEYVSRIKIVETILKILSEATGLRNSAVVSLAEDKWTAACTLKNNSFGLDAGDQLDMETTYWQEIKGAVAPLLVNNASQDKDYNDHPGFTNLNIESFIGVPLFRPNGELLGTLCAFDTKPSNLDIDDFELFDLFAKLITHELEIEEANVIRETALKESIETNEARARFMSILGHDLRGPLNTIVMAANIQKTATLDGEKSKDFSEKILRAAKRMQHLIDDLLDTTRAVQGDKISIDKKPADLREICENIIEEFRISRPENKIKFYAEENCHGDWDERRLGQVLSNLLSNAIHYGDPNQPIKVNLIEECDKVLLQVNNRGRIIPHEIASNLFRPFWRGARKRANSSGLGLGLYIVKQIVEAHDGTISVESNREYGTTFTATFEKPEEKNKAD